MSLLNDLLDRLWKDYTALNPEARRVFDVLSSRGEEIANDHIAFRTFDDPRINIDQVAAPFLNVGYVPGEDYTFPEKKLSARHFEHPDAGRPKVFISALRTAEFSEAFQTEVRELVEQVPTGLPGQWDFPACGRPWKVTYAAYERLRAESQYAAWLAAFGFRANHFTVNVNALKGFENLEALTAFLKESGFSLNTSGGEIKGSPEVYLEQASTLASEVPVEFTDGAHMIPACYYEFAMRYPLPDGKLFQGFVAKSADKIFESTDRNK